MHPAVIVVDMLKDSLNDNSKMAKEARKIINPINNLLREARKLSLPIIFACDSFLLGDFIFKGRMKPYAIRGTKGAEVIDELEREKDDIILPKRRFSAFFKTDLDQTLRLFDVDTVAVCGIATNFCVLATVFDALSLDFSAIIIEDCCAAHKKEAHQTTINNYKHHALFPLLRVMNSHDFLDEVKSDN